MDLVITIRSLVIKLITIRATKVTGIEMLIGVVTMEEEVALAEVFQGKEGVIRIMVVIGTMDLGVVVEHVIIVLI